MPTGQSILIDAGDVQCGDRIVSYLREVGVKKIDYVIASHPHADHIGGLDKVIENFDVGNIYMPDIIHTTKTFENLLSTIGQKGLKINIAQKGTIILEEEKLKAVFLAPGAKTAELNNMSAVLKITYGDNNFLFMGDAEKESELEMLNSNIILNADVIKIGHHGSRTSSTDSFISAVSPKYAFISCGKENSYGHPSLDTLNTLSKYGVKIYRTDEVGTIILRSDGKNITLDKNASEIQPNAPPQATNQEQKAFPVSEVKKDTQTTSNKNIEVFTTNTGKRYHRGTCSSLKKSKHLTTVEKAQVAGFTPCGNCHPPQ